MAHGRIGVTEDAVQARALFVHLLRLVCEIRPPSQSHRRKTKSPRHTQLNRQESGNDGNFDYETVCAGASELTGELDEILAVHVVRVVARVEVLAAGRIEDETIGTDRFNGLTLATVPVRVAELFVRVFAVLLVGAFEVPGQRCGNAIGSNRIINKKAKKAGHWSACWHIPETASVQTISAVKNFMVCDG